MLVILLKSSACLAFFMLFYKLCLEKTSVHTFKRFYLIGVLFMSIGIPFITFTEYIEVEPVNLTSVIEPITYSTDEFIDVAQPKDYLPTILWSIYALGVILFSFRFFKNLYEIIQKIKRNPKFKSENFINVLLNDLIHPHTFFNYIFFNKTKYKNNQIPNEVFLHEQTHAKQKHALDILFIEVLQIIFWFNPLLYFIKKDIKLNHEFLADQAVLKHGIESSTYQNILLAFSSNASHSSLANAINYSLIKKRFTVMKIKTSKQTVWLRSFILLPLLAILIYGFSEKKVIEIETNTQLTDQKSYTDNEIKIFINKEKKVLIENKLIDFEDLSEELIKIANRSKNKTIKPSLYIEIEGHVTDDYFEEIKNKIVKTNLKVSKFRANSILLDKNKSDPYFKGTEFTADYMVLENKKGEIMEGVSIPENTSYSQNENLKSLLKYLKNKEANYIQSLNKVKNQKEKTEINERIDFLKSRIKLVNNKLGSKPKTIQKYNYKKNNLIIIKIINNETIFINDKKCTLENLESRIIEIIKDLSPKEKAKLTPITVFNNQDGDKTRALINNILRKHKLLRQEQIVYLKQKKVNVKNISNQQKATPEQVAEYNSSLKKYIKTGFLNTREWTNTLFIYDYIMSPTQREENKKPPKAMKGDPEILKLNITREDVKNNPEIIKQIEEYNTLAKKFNSNPKAVFKTKDIKRVITLYNLMSDEHKKGAEPFPKFTPPPAIPENANN